MVLFYNRALDDLIALLYIAYKCKREKEETATGAEGGIFFEAGSVPRKLRYVGHNVNFSKG